MSPSESSSPTVVLVHGAFADASGWAGVIAALDRAGVNSVAPPNPLRGIPSDAAYLTSFVNQLKGPAVLVGHSYGGAVITQTGSDAKNSVGLVFVSAFAPDADEKLGEINARYPDVPLSAALRPQSYSDGANSGMEAFIDLDLFHEAFCADLPADQARVMALTQRPISLNAFTDVVTGTPAWKNLPSWAVLGKSDHAIHPDAERDMAKRANAETVELDGSHVVFISKAAAVADVILRAVQATS
jgi:pimeloyl-ACP methyl ester carboxylesterase